MVKLDALAAVAMVVFPYFTFLEGRFGITVVKTITKVL
jgi:hypothetical protein